MQKQRWRWTKHPLYCPICHDRVGHNDKYFNTYGFCSKFCGYDYYGFTI